MIKVNTNKAKEVAHERRRQDRDAKMAPLDLKATIPSEAASAEAEREAIRAHNAGVQSEIDKAASDTDIKRALGKLNDEPSAPRALHAVNE
ncbi:hypothetical protein NVP1009O_25 [Vibrio phage 1.009.O._10N.261.51.C9]|nr:hypothetical protein NVP1009O_25 [Vibrio phage 1.009.O._10N.261.51.C9]